MSEIVDEFEGDASLIYVIGRLNHGIRREMRQLLSPWKLSVPEFTALSILDRRPGLSNAQLARRTMVTPQSMIEILAGLETRKLVRRAVDPNHGRILKAELTEEGARVVKAAQVVVDRIQEELLAGLSPAERTLITESMSTAMRRLGHAGARG